MTDLVERLRNDPEHMQRDFREALILDAADEIEKLREWNRLRAEDIMNLGQQVGAAEAEIERLRAELELSRQNYNSVVENQNHYANLWQKAADEIERLRKALNEALDGWESAPPDAQDDLERIKEIRETQ